MNKLLKSLGLLLPPLRRLHEERDRYAADVEKLNLQVREAYSVTEQLKQDATTLKEEVVALEDERSKLLQQQQVMLGNIFPNLAELNSAIREASHSLSNLNEKIDHKFLYLEASSENRYDNYIQSDHGLFVVGHARSGTTIMVDALNSSKDVYCLGEANIHQNINRNDFCVWYNNMHQQFNNPLMKSTYLPDYSGLSGWLVLHELWKNYKYIGEKVAFRQEALGYDYNSFFNFSSKYFALSNYVCVIRHPENVFESNIKMFMSGDFNEENFQMLFISQMQTYYLILSLVLTLPYVFVVIHERISQETFNSLGNQLGIDLKDAGAYYDVEIMASKKELPSIIPMDSLLKITEYYNQFVNLFDPKTLKPVNNLKVRNLSFEIYSVLKEYDKLPENKTLRND